MVYFTTELTVLAESSKKGHGSQRTVLPVVVMMMMMMVLVVVMIKGC
jgi:hypothetical protein